MNTSSSSVLTADAALTTSSTSSTRASVLGLGYALGPVSVGGATI